MFAFSAASWKGFAMYCASVLISTDGHVSDSMHSSKTFKLWLLIGWDFYKPLFVFERIRRTFYHISFSEDTFCKMYLFCFKVLLCHSLDFLVMSKFSTTTLTSFLFSFLISVPSRNISAVNKLLRNTDAEPFSTCFETILKVLGCLFGMP